MLRYILSRFLSALLVLLILSILVFAMVRLIPGNPLAPFIDPANPDPVRIATLRAELGLDKPWVTQYFVWLLDVLRGDFGRSISQPYQVSELLSSRLQVSLQMAVMATIIAVVIGVPAGVLAATQVHRTGDFLVRGLSFFFLATPPFVLGVVLILVNSLTLQLPLIGFVPFSVSPANNLGVMFFPALLIGLVLAALIARYTRGSLLDTFNEDFIRTARAKGAGPRRLVRQHALRNALIPVVTIVGIELAALVGGSVVVEEVFTIPGMGQLLIQGIQASDYPVIQASVLVMGAIYVVLNLLVDLLYPLVDPRVRVAGQRRQGQAKATA